MVANRSTARRIHTDVRPKAPAEVRTGEIATNLDRLLHDRMRLGIVSDRCHRAAVRDRDGGAVRGRSGDHL